MTPEERAYFAWWNAERAMLKKADAEKARLAVEMALEGIMARRGFVRATPGTWANGEGVTFRHRKLVRWLAPLWVADRVAAVKKIEGELDYQIEHPRRRSA